MSVLSRLPDPAERPLLRVDELVGLVPGMKRSALFEAVRRGDLPSCKVGRHVYIPTAQLRRQWGFAEPENSEAGPASPAVATTAEDSGDPRHGYGTGNPLRAV